MYVHTAVLLAFVGERPEGLEACHNNGIPSDNRLENLRWDTRSSNRRDTILHGKDHNKFKAECKNGHPFDGENLSYRPDGARRCKTCTRENMRRYRRTTG